MKYITKVISSSLKSSHFTILVYHKSYQEMSKSDQITVEDLGWILSIEKITTENKTAKTFFQAASENKENKTIPEKCFYEQ